LIIVVDVFFVVENNAKEAESKARSVMILLSAVECFVLVECVAQSARSTFDLCHVAQDQVLCTTADTCYICTHGKWLQKLLFLLRM